MLKNDLKNDIEKTLQAHCPEPPEGFAERMDNKAISLMQKKHNQNVNKGRSRYRLPVLAVAAALVLCFVTAASRDLIIRPDAIRARETATPLVTALSEGHGEVTEGEGLSQEAIEALEVNFPGVADKLKPVNLSCEKQGIRMNVISALVEDDKSWVVYSLQDLEGDRISRFATMDVDLLGFVGDVPGYYCYLDHNQEEHKVTCVHYEEYDEPYHPVDNHFAFKVEDIGREQVVKIDILPFLKQYAKTSEGVKAPEDASVYSTQGDVKYAWSVKVLEDTDPLNVDLYKDIYLTGIGWIDDQLHVRIQDRQQEKITIGSMSVYPVFLSAAGYFSETGKQCEMDQVEWSSAGDERKDLKEYIFDVRPDEVDKMELAAWADDTVDVTRDVWEVQIPADSIMAETAAEQAAQEETLTTEDPVTKALREEIDNWVTSSEDIVQELKPVNLSYEKQGIQVEIISALVKGTQLWLVYSVQDLEGDRISSYTRDSDFVYVSVNTTEQTPNDETSAMLLFSEEEKKITYVRRFGFDQRIESKKGMIELEFGKFQLIHDEEVDLTEHLRQYGSRAKSVKPPDGAKGFGGYLEDETKVSWKDAKVLDSSNPLDIQVFMDIYLTGIGWTDGQMHAQFRCTDREEYMDAIPAGYLSVWIAPEFSEEENFMGYGTVEWKPEDGSNTKWIDQTINCTREEAESMKLSANVMEYVDVVDDYWTIQIPYDEIKAGSGANVENEDESDESILNNLWWFFDYWFRGENAYLQKVCTDEWKEKQPDPEQAVRELMASGKPRGFKLNGVSGNDGDPVRTADVSVRWLTEDGGYTYSRHEITVRRQKSAWGREEYLINPDGFSAGVSVEHVPENEMYPITEEALIRDTIGAHIQEVSYDEMIPISGLSTEKQGMRLEAVSGCVKRDKAYILCMVQDVEGKYDGLELHVSTEWNEDGNNSVSCPRVYWNRAENRSAWLYEVEQPGLLKAENGTIEVKTNWISATDEKEIDLIPFLKEYGKDEAGVALPELLKNPTIQEISYPDVDKVLDYKHPLDISLWEGTKLTGIGWIDGRLHIQVNSTWDGEPVSVNIYTPVQHQYYRPLEWVDDNNYNATVQEFVLDVNPEEIEQSTLTVGIIKTKASLNDSWELQVPISILLPETGADTAVQEEAAETANPLSIEEEVNRKIEEKWPGITKELKPVNLSCEKQGIRLAVSSVVMKENKSWFVFSLEDLEGSRIKQDTGSCFNMFNLNGERNITASASWEYLYYDESKHKIAYAVCMEYDGSYQSQDNDFIVQIEAIGVSGKSQIDLLPFLKEYGNVTEGVEAPAEAVSIYDFVNRKDLKVLDYKNPLDVELGKDVYLAGIGWIDDQLHVQIYDMQPYGLEIGQMYTKPLNCSVNAFFPEQINNRPVLGDIVNLKNDLIRRDEYIFDVSPDETDNMVLYADMTEVLEVLRDNWEVRIPLESILAEGEDTTNQETAAPSV